MSAPRENIRKAALLIAYDNGFINRTESEEEWLEKIEPVLGADGVYESDLELLDGWLGSLSADDLETVCTGEVLLAKEIVINKGCPRNAEGQALSGLLDDIFEAG